MIYRAGALSISCDTSDWYEAAASCRSWLPQRSMQTPMQLHCQGQLPYFHKAFWIKSRLFSSMLDLIFNQTRPWFWKIFYLLRLIFAFVLVHVCVFGQHCCMSSRTCQRFFSDIPLTGWNHNIKRGCWTKLLVPTIVTEVTWRWLWRQGVVCGSAMEDPTVEAWRFLETVALCPLTGCWCQVLEPFSVFSTVNSLGARPKKGSAPAPQASWFGTKNVWHKQHKVMTV